MPPASKKRKISAGTNRDASTLITIASFGRISKAGLSAPSTKANLLSNKEQIQNEDCRAKILESSFTKKRKISDSIETPPKPQTYDKSYIRPACTTNALQSTAQYTQSKIQSPALPALPIKPRKKAPSRPKIAQTPTKGARAFLEAFAFSSSPSGPRGSSPLPRYDETPPTSPISVKSPCPVKASIERLTPEVEDLATLNGAFLTALSLHYAHNGPHTPADLRVLRSSIERAWGKRRICTEDIQRVLGILHHDEPIDQQKKNCPLFLSDYGNGKTCIETTQQPSHNGFSQQPVEVQRLAILFHQNIHKLWQQHTSQDNSTFLSTLPLASVTPCPSLSKIAPLLVKGQRRLEDLKAGAIRAQITNNAPKTSPSTQQPSQPKPATSRSDSLLSRIRSKELHQSTLPAPPSADALARKSALQRLEEVIPVLEILTSSGSRSAHDGAATPRAGLQTFSFTMPTLVQHLQMSLRHPISKDEAVRCVRLLAEEIVPGWVGVREVGKMLGVTIRGAKGFGREEVRGRITEVMGRT